MKPVRVYPESYRRGFAQIIIVFGLVIVAILVGLILYLNWPDKKPVFLPTPGSATKDSKQVSPSPITQFYKSNEECQTKTGKRCDCMLTKPDTAESNPTCEGWGPIHASSTVDETANWKTYKGEDYSLKYPPAWIMVSPGDFRIEDKVIKIFGAHRESAAYLGNFANWCKFEPPCSGFVSPVQTKIINGFEAYQYTSTDERASKLPGITVYFPHNGRMYKVSWGIWPKDLSNYKFSDLVKEVDDPIFNQILSTFKFTL